MFIVSRCFKGPQNLTDSFARSKQWKKGMRFGPWFDDECSKLIYQRKQAKLQWLQNPSQMNGDNLKNLKRETSRTFRNKKQEYLKRRINELETKIKNKNIRDL
jgi:hypothetical protein